MVDVVKLKGRALRAGAKEEAIAYLSFVVLP
jgi:hypothetical protein